MNGGEWHQMLLTGTFKRSVDDKLRIAIPKRFRDEISSHSAKPTLLYVAPGTDGSLSMYTEESFTLLADQLSKAPPAGHDVRAFSRLFYARAQTVDVDRQGRTRIPTDLASLANLQGDAVLVGVRDHIEIWNSASWSRYLQANQQNYDQLAERALSGESGKEVS
jgi:MraZ protein